MSHTRRRRGDLNDTWTLELKGTADLTAIDTLTGHVWIYVDGELIEADLDAEVTDADERTAVLQLGGADGWLSDAQRGKWWSEVHGTFLDGSRLTWPQPPQNDGELRTSEDWIIVRDP